MLRRPHDDHRGLRAGMRAPLPTISDSRHYQNRHLMTTITGVGRCNIDLASRWSSAGRDDTYPNASRHRQSEPATTTPNECLHLLRQLLSPIKRVITRSRAHCDRLLTPSASTKSPEQSARRFHRTLTRGFVPWRLSDAGHCAPGSVVHGRHPKPCTIPDSCTAANIREGLSRGQFRVLVCRVPF